MVINNPAYAGVDAGFLITTSVKVHILDFDQGLCDGVCQRHHVLQSKQPNSCSCQC